MKYGVMLSVRHLPSSERSDHRKAFRASKYRKEALAEYLTEGEAIEVVNKLNAEQENFKFTHTGFEPLPELNSHFQPKE